MPEVIDDIMPEGGGGGGGTIIVLGADVTLHPGGRVMVA
jgi:hypothetical protein